MLFLRFSDVGNVCGLMAVESDKDGEREEGGREERKRERGGELTLKQHNKETTLRRSHRRLHFMYLNNSRSCYSGHISVVGRVSEAVAPGVEEGDTGGEEQLSRRVGSSRRSSTQSRDMGEDKSASMWGLLIVILLREKITDRQRHRGVGKKKRQGLRSS